MYTYILTEKQKQACESLWRAMCERREYPLGLSRQILPPQDAQAKFEVVKTVRMLPMACLPQIIDTETDRYGPLADNVSQRWTHHTLRAKGDPRPLLQPLQLPSKPKR